MAVALPLGKVTMTQDHDYRQFFVALLLVFAIGMMVVWSYTDGLLVRAYESIGIQYAIGFAAILVIGCAYGLTQVWWFSTTLNKLKVAGLDAKALRQLFGIPDMRTFDLELLKEEIDDQLSARLTPLGIFIEAAVLLGMFGTVHGILIGLDPMSSIQSTNDVFGKLGTMSDGLKLAFATTLVGIPIGFAMKLLKACTHVSYLKLKNRIFRMLHSELGSS